MSNYCIGPLSFSIEGEGELASLIKREFSSVEVSQGVGSASLVFDLGECRGPVAPPPIVSDWLKVYDSGFNVNFAGLQYSFSAQGSQRVVSVSEPLRSIQRSKSLRGKVNKILDWNYLSSVETLAKNFIYNVFDYVSQVELMQSDASYLHASAITKGARCLVITGKGGIGKSSMMLKAVIEDGWQYLSDDLLVVDAAGIVWRTPKHLQIYGYNLQGEPVLQSALMKGRGAIDLAMWNARLYFAGGKRVRRRVAAEDLFGAGQIAQSSLATDVYFLERHESEQFRERGMSHAEFARRSANVLLEELHPLSKISLALHGADSRRILPDVSEFLRRSEAIILKAVKNVQVRHICVPHAATPKDLMWYFKSNGFL